MKKLFFITTLILWNTSFQLSAQISNPDFESWAEDNTPLDWEVSSNGSGKTTDAHTGSSAVKIWNWYYYVGAFLVNGNFSALVPENFYKGGMPVSENPIRLSGYYKYILDDNMGKEDSAVVYILLKKYNQNLSKVDTVVFVEKKLGPADSYTDFHVDIPTSSTQADSIVIAFFSGLSTTRCDGEGDGDCCFLYLDDLMLDTPTGTIPGDQWLGKYKIYPNPFSQDAIIDLGEIGNSSYTLKIYDISGMEVRKINRTGGHIKIDRNNLTPGIYFFKAETDKGEIMEGKFTVD